MSKKPETEQGLTFTMETLKMLLDANREQTLDAIRELKKLPDHEQQALDEKLERSRQNRVNRVREAVSEERTKRENQFNCRHMKAQEGIMKQTHAFRGQVNNDNCCRALCVRCFKQFPPFKVSQEQLKSGMSLQNAPTLTAEVILTAHMKSFPDCKECKAGGCAVRDLRELKSGALDPLPDVLPDGKIAAIGISA